MAVLLIAPILHCSLHQIDEHTHPAATVAALSIGSSQTDHLHDMSGPVGHRGDQHHMIFCIEKSVLPGGVTVLPLLWVILIGMAIVATMTLMFTAGDQGIRGPPGSGPLMLNGQAILTNFCISRR
ncbi:hypothetical protein [Nocardia sp. R6R-6]|uniref:hypothetical protein n=1 Tax=Nocardia sp. R6R-6 TaxID=3459303 RepID=UPI00403DD1C8